MNILITGVSGLVGSAVVQKLANSHTVVGISRRKNPDIDAKMIYHAINIADTFALNQLKAYSIDIIVHCAASLYQGALNLDLLQTNYMGLQNIAHLASRLNCKQFIYLSSIPLIGIPLQIPITESHPIHPLTPYHYSKYFGEQFLADYLQNCKLTILRIPSPIGPLVSEKTFLAMCIKNSLLNKEIILYGKGQRIQNYINVKDIANAVALAIHHQSAGIYNIASTHSFSNMEIAQICQAQLKSTAPIVCEGVDKQENEKWIISIKKAQKELFFHPEISIEHSIQEIAQHICLNSQL